MVRFRPNWVNGWFLRWLADPFVTLDGLEVQASWRHPTRLSAGPGDHRLSTYVRYRHTSWDLGRGVIDLDVRAGEVVAVETANGMLNHTPFRPRLLRSVDASSLA